MPIRVIYQNVCYLDLYPGLDENGGTVLLIIEKFNFRADRGNDEMRRE